MKNPLLLLGTLLTGALIALAVLSYQLWNEGEDLRSEIAALKSAARAQPDRIKRPNSADSVSSAELPLSGGQGEPPPGKAAPYNPDKPTKKADNPMAVMAVMMKDPKMRKAMEAQQMRGVKMMYSDLFEDLELSDKDRAALSELLLEKMLHGSEIGMKMMAGELKAGEMKKLGKEVLALQAESEERIREFFGDDERYERYELYNQTHGERRELQAYKRSLTGEEIELSAEQEQQLMDTMYESRRDFDFTDNLDFQNQGNLDYDALSEESLNRNLAERDQLRAQVYQRASEFLSEEQLRAFQANQEATRAQEEMGYRMAIQMMARPSEE